MWVIWVALVVVGVIFVCGIAVGVYFDLRGWLKTPHQPSPGAAPALEPALITHPKRNSQWSKRDDGRSHLRSSSCSSSPRSTCWPRTSVTGPTDAT